MVTRPQLAEIGVDLWASETNLRLLKSAMPGGAKLFDLTTMVGSSLVDGPAWDRELGPGISELFTTRLDAFFAGAHPENGATCTLCHGDLRGDNIFFCEPSERYPDGWLCIDFQLMFRSPVPSDLAYVLGTASVLPDVYAGPNLDRVLRAFYDEFMSKTKVYRGYSSSGFSANRSCPRPLHLGGCAPIWQAGASPMNGHRSTRQRRRRNRSHPEERRQRMWWRSSCPTTARTSDVRPVQKQALPENLDDLGVDELPSHLR
jgi:hypothetical protein